MKQGLSFRTLLIVILFTVSACNIRSPETAKTPTTEQERIATSKPPLVGHGQTNTVRDSHRPAYAGNRHSYRH